MGKKSAVLVIMNAIKVFFIQGITITEYKNNKGSYQSSSNHPCLPKGKAFRFTPGKAIRFTPSHGRSEMDCFTPG